MIVKFEFSNYRSFRDKCTFSMETVDCDVKSDNYFYANDDTRLLNSAIVYGANASGKTNLIRCIFVLSSLVNDKFNIPGDDGMWWQYDPFIFSASTDSKPSEISITFIVGNKTYSYSIIYNRKMIIKEELNLLLEEKIHLLFSRKNEGRGLSYCTPSYGNIVDYDEKPIFKVFSNKTLLSKYLNDTPHSLITPAARYIANIGTINSAKKNRINLLEDEDYIWLKNRNNKERLTRLLRIADLGVQEISVDENKEIFMGHRYYLIDGTISRNYTGLRFANESYGTKQMFELGIKILKSLDHGTPLFIDEIDNGLHTYMSDFIISLFKNKKINRKNAQLVITTHDTNLMNENKLRRDQIWFTSKSSEGVSDLYSLADFKEVHEDTNFEQWYLNNMFGATPNINMRDCENIFDV